MADWAEWVWLSGRLVRGEDASVSVFDRSFLLGDGLFETMRARGGRVFRMSRHLARLEEGAARISLRLSWSREELAAAIQATLEAHEVQEAAIRLTVSRGVGPPGPSPAGASRPTAVVAVRPFAGYPEHWYRLGATAVISRGVKNELSPWAGLKTTSYLEHVLARGEAAERGADEALLVNTQGHLCEASSSNLFIATGGVLCTPDLSSGCLPGITREVVLEIARQSGTPIREVQLLPASLPEWDEAFLTNSLLGIAPLVRVDDLSIGSGQPGPVTMALAARYKEVLTDDMVNGASVE